MNDQPIRDWVIEGVNSDGQVPGPGAGVDHSGYLESGFGGPFDSDHRSIKSGRRSQSTDLLFPKISAFREANGMKPGLFQTDYLEIMKSYQRNSTFYRATFFAKKTGLISDAQERIEPFGGLKQCICPIGAHPQIPDLLRELTRIRVIDCFNGRQRLKRSVKIPGFASLFLPAIRATALTWTGTGSLLFRSAPEIAYRRLPLGGFRSGIWFHPI
jgi:hypothetical protein